MRLPPVSNSSHAEKIVYVCNELGAFRNHREHLAEAMIRSGFRAIVFATPVGANTDGIDYEFRPIVIERYKFHLTLDFLLFSKLFATLVRERPQILHLIGLKPYLFGGLAALCARWFGWKGGLVITVPGLGRLYDPNASRPKRAALRRRIVQMFIRLVARKAQVTFETERDRDVWLKHGLTLPAKATVMTGAGVDLSRFYPPERDDAAHQLAVLFAGRLLRQKGVDVYVQAANIIKQSDVGPSIRMFVAGFIENDPDGFPIGELEANPAIDFLGHVTDMAGLLRTIDVVVLPSRYGEGIPRILIEAAACGCVLIATRFPGSEALITQGETGFFLQADDAAGQTTELVRAILDLGNDPPLRLTVGANAARLVRESGFGTDEVVARFKAVYDRAGGGDETPP